MFSQCICTSDNYFYPFPLEASQNLTFEGVSRNLTSNHTLAFSRDNLLRSRNSPSEWAGWDSAVKDANRYVLNTKSDISTTNKSSILSDINKSNDTLVNTTKILQNRYAGKAIGPQDRQQIESLLTPLTPVIPTMKKVSNFVAPSVRKKDAVAAILDQLALTIELTAEKLLRDARAI